MTLKLNRNAWFWPLHILSWWEKIFWPIKIFQCINHVRRPIISLLIKITFSLVEEWTLKFLYGLTREKGNITSSILWGEFCRLSQLIEAQLQTGLSSDCLPGFFSKGNSPHICSPWWQGNEQTGVDPLCPKDLWHLNIKPEKVKIKDNVLYVECLLAH